MIRFMTRMAGDPNWPGGAGRMLGAAWQRTADLLWPPVCGACEAPTTAHGQLCSECWDRVRFIGAPQCAACGLPFPHELGKGALCGGCARARPRIDRARAAFKPMILAFKHGDRSDLLPALVGHLLRPGRVLLEDADLIVPVPLHWRRMLRRRFNQSALLANGLAARTGVPSWPDLLVRVKPTRTQGGLGRQGRIRNVAGAFRVRERHLVAVAGKRVLLIDDVATTGATLDAAARALLKAGAAAVDALTIARVIGPSI